jgi:hypothetical protein
MGSRGLPKKLKQVDHEARRQGSKRTMKDNPK